MLWIQEKLILRTPRFSMSEYFDASNFTSLFLNNDFHDAILLASQDLFNSVINKKGLYSESLFRYATRSCFRSTPFGLFSAVSVVDWGESSKIQLADLRKRIVMDIQVINSVVDKIHADENVLKELTYTINNSLYVIGNMVRYVEWNALNGARNYVLSEVELCEELKAIISTAQSPVSFRSLAETLVQKNIKTEDADDFLIELIKNRILVSHLEPEITSHMTAWDTLRSKLENLCHIEKIFSVCKQMDEVSKLISVANCHNASIQQIVSDLKMTFNKFQVSNVRNPIRLDLVRSCKERTLDKTIKQNLTNAIQILTKLHGDVKHEHLEQFKTRFINRFGEREIPLMDALDSLTGVGYPEASYETTNTLTSDLSLQVPEPSTGFSQLELFLIKKLKCHCLTGSREAIEISEDDLNQFNGSDQSLPNSFSVYFRVTDFLRNEILVESIGGANAIQCLGRFGTLDSEIYDLAESVSKLEVQQQEGRIIAEIVHLPEDSYGNAMLRPAFFEFEIKYLSNGCASEYKTIRINDLYVKLNQGKVVLYSKKLNKEIVPRLSNAHNHNLSPLPVYRFLCDLQSQDYHTNLSFSYGKLYDIFNFLPQVKIGSVIVHPATWTLTGEDFRPVLSSSDTKLAEEAAKFQAKYHLPQFISLIEEDQELFIDLKNLSSVNSFLALLKRKERVTIREFLFDAHAPVLDENGQVFMNEFIATVQNTVCRPMSFQNHNSSVIRQTFLPGSEWMYYKIYCSPKAMDKILIRLKPILDELVLSNVASKWFFIRFKESSHHIRLRILLTVPMEFVKITQIFKNIFEEYLALGIISNVSINMYERESDRYPKIEYVESLFYYSSDAILQFLSQLDSLNTDKRWLWGISSINRLLEEFNCTLHEKQQIMAELADEFKHEFAFNKQSEINIDRKFRKFRKDIEIALTQAPAFENLLLEKKGQKALVGEILYDLKGGDVRNLIKNVIHLELNRLLPFPQRLQERVIYYLLSRTYGSEIARLQTSASDSKLTTLTL
jgi:thiopeptide-type bacteriocin biosynthesis protein